MPISDIKRINSFKFFTYFTNNLLIINHPHSMCNLIILRKIICCFMIFFPVIHQLKKRFRVSACKKNRACVSIAGIHVVNSVLFLIFPGQLMFLDYTIHIIINRAASYNASLRPALSYKFIYVVARLFILEKNSCFFHVTKIFSCFLINPFII